ncbi:MULTISPECIES: DUF1870 family protein [unclassified Micromonospora]|uniref:helix-turn-helix domain-containing protein n=1 Tax=unclassified Micromonospora TaxID=2617518 RepID=UPI00331E4957
MTTYTDPPNMPEDERMTDAEFRVVREYLGLTGDWLAGHLGVSARTVRHWEQGKYPIPDGVRLAIESLEAETTAFVGAVVENLLASNDTDLAVVTYRSDADYRAAHPQLDWPASWHRAVIARVAQEVLGLAIVYASSTAGDPS